MKRTLCTLLALLCLLLAACGSKTGEPAAGSADAAENAAPVKIETPYGDLTFPGGWGDQLKTETEQDGERQFVHFRANIADQQFDLFDVTIAPDEGDSVGTIKAADGTIRNVFVEVFDLDADGLAAADQDTLFAMQEGVNDLIDALNH